MGHIEPDWDELARNFPVGTWVCGHVKAKFPYGIWIEARTPVHVEWPNFLLELIRISDDPAEADEFADRVAIGDTICGVVIWNEREVGVRLSSRRTECELYGVEGFLKESNQESMEFMSFEEKLTLLLKEIVRKLVQGEYRELEQSQFQGGCLDEEIRYGMVEYPGKPTMPPDEAFEKRYVLSVRPDYFPEWAVDFNLWYDGEESDNTLQLAVLDVNGRLEFQIRGIHVM